jgi:hypothetical protein
MCVFKSHTGYTDYGGYVVKRDSAYTHVRVNDHIVAGRSVSSTDNPLPSVFIVMSFLVHGSKIVNYYNAVAEDMIRVTKLKET